MYTGKIQDRTIIASVSGGKDSTALLLFLRENDIKPVMIFADTGWEHDETYKYLNYLEEVFGKIIRVKPELNFVELAKKKKMFPSAKCRFCTTELKLKPIKKYLVENYDINKLVMCCGVRGEESRARAAMDEWCDTDEYYKCAQWRPLLRWTWQDVFAIHKKYNVRPNPLYKKGMSRVGCMPCVMANKRELTEIAKRFPDVFEKVQKVEQEMPGDHFSFWRPGDIPARYCSTEWTGQDGKIYKIPKAKDVFEYVKLDPIERRKNTFSLFTEPENEDFEMCSSIYGLCE